MAENIVVSVFPVRCGTCGKKLSRVAKAYERFRQNPEEYRTPEGEQMDFRLFCESLGISNYCCRMNMLCQPVIVAGTYVPKLPEGTEDEPLITPEMVRQRIGNVPVAGLTNPTVISAASYLKPGEIAEHRTRTQAYSRSQGNAGVTINPDLLRSLNRLNIRTRNFTSVPAALSILESNSVTTLPATVPGVAVPPSPKMAPAPGSMLERAVSQVNKPPALSIAKPAAKPAATVAKPVAAGLPLPPPPTQLPSSQLPLQPLQPMVPVTKPAVGATIRAFAMKPAPTLKSSALPGTLPGTLPK